jgi:hypothetical protein
VTKEEAMQSPVYEMGERDGEAKGERKGEHKTVLHLYELRLGRTLTNTECTPA